MIDKLGWICIKNGKLLVARSKGENIYYIPGGKREKTETDQEALVREIKEELSVNLLANTIQYAKTFTTQAHGMAAGNLVKVICYFAECAGEIQASAEIAEIKWIEYEDKHGCSLATQEIIKWLRSINLMHSREDAKKHENLLSSSNLLSKYEWIIFDADDTLFHFDAFGGLKLMFSHYKIEFTMQDYQEYQVVNKALWKNYQDGSITAQDVKSQRFDKWSAKLKVSSQELNTNFLFAMGEICTPLDGAQALLNILRGKVKLGIITNGFAELQETRLQKTELMRYFDLLVVSERVGFAKPHQGIFAHASSLMGHPQQNKVLMIGDTLESDILGGNNAGWDTCWLNVNSKPLVNNIIPTYQASSHAEIANLLLTQGPPRGEFLSSWRLAQQEQNNRISNANSMANVSTSTQCISNVK